jgi:hypothetical protein
MGWRDRSDGVLLGKLPGFRKLFPYLMPTRTESVIYHSQLVNLGKTLPYLEQLKAGEGKRVSLFHVILAAAVRTLALRPDANRFVAGRRIYQRRSIDLSFVVKRELTEESGETNVKLTFDPRSTLAEVAARVNEGVRGVKGSTTSADERTCDILTSLPRSVTRLAMAGVRDLDYFGLLPASFVKGDALYTSAYIANLGSIGLDAVYHHMFEWGNAAFFIVVGKPKKVPGVSAAGTLEVQELMEMRFSLDERITDGVHYAKTIALLTELIEDPERLARPPGELPDPFALA